MRQFCYSAQKAEHNFRKKNLWIIFMTKHIDVCEHEAQVKLKPSVTKISVAIGYFIFFTQTAILYLQLII